MRVMLADDAVLFREGMARILAEIGFTVAAQVGDGPHLLALARVDPPDVAVIDLRMPPGFAAEGLETAAALRAMLPDTGLMLLSQYVEVHHALRLMTEFDGGVGYLLKDRVSDLSSFGADLRKVARGETVIDPELVARLVARRRQRDPLDRLTDRERGVLALMAQGLSNAAIAQEMHLAVKTVEAHVTAIFTKLELAPDEREHRRVLAVLTFLRA
jgi:DNA-binding NarL/FixJ family response regulator